MLFPGAPVLLLSLNGRQMTAAARLLDSQNRFNPSCTNNWDGSSKVSNIICNIKHTSMEIKSVFGNFNIKLRLIEDFSVVLYFSRDVHLISKHASFITLAQYYAFTTQKYVFVYPSVLQDNTK